MVESLTVIYASQQQVLQVVVAFDIREGKHFSVMLNELILWKKHSCFYEVYFCDTARFDVSREGITNGTA